MALPAENPDLFGLDAGTMFVDTIDPDNDAHVNGIVVDLDLDNEEPAADGTADVNGVTEDDPDFIRIDKEPDEEMADRPEQSPRSVLFLAYQANVKNSRGRVNDLLSHARGVSRPPDIIAIQDPPDALPFMSTEPYVKWYEPERPLTEDDSPWCRAEAKKASKKAKRDDDTDKEGFQQPAEEDQPQFLLHRVCFLVHESIPPTSWRVEVHDSNAKMAATLSIKMSTGQLDIHNVYNNKPHFDVAELLGRVAASRNSLLVGDFNLHHVLWNGTGTWGDVPKANELAEGLQGAGMECLTRPGTITFSRSMNTDSQSSTIDLTFTNEHFADRGAECRVVNIERFASDHRVIETILDMEPGRHNPVRRLWKKTNTERFLEAIRAKLPPDYAPSVEEPHEIDERIHEINTALASAIDECVRTVPRFRQRFHRSPNEELSRLNNAWHRAHDRYMRTKRPQDLNHLRKLAAEREKLQRSIRSEEWHQLITEKAKTINGGYKVAKLGKKLVQPQESAQSPALTVDGKTYRTDEDKELILRESIWRGSTQDESHEPLQTRADTAHDVSSCPPSPAPPQLSPVSD